MKKLLLVALVGAYAFAQEVTPKQESLHKIEYDIDSGYYLDGQKWQTEHNVEYSYKFNEAYKFKSQLDFYIDYLHDNDASKWKGYTELNYWRHKVIRAPFFSLLGFDTGWEARYAMPMTAGDQKAGSYGVGSFRLNMSKQFGSRFKLTVKPIIGLHPARRSYQQYVPVGSTPKDEEDLKANKLVDADFEVVLQYKITPNIEVTYDGDVDAAIMGKTPTQGKNILQYEYEHDLSVMYTISRLHDLGVGPFWYTDFKFGNHTYNATGNPGLFQGGSNIVGIRLDKTFDL